jgi:hypothetical protein
MNEEEFFTVSRREALMCRWDVYVGGVFVASEHYPDDAPREEVQTDIQIEYGSDAVVLCGGKAR